MENWRKFMIEQAGASSTPLSGVGVHGTSPSRIPVARDIVPARSLTKWDKFLRFLRKIPGPGKKLFAIFSAGALAKGARDAYTQGYNGRDPGIRSFVDYSASQGIIEAIPGAGEVYSLLKAVSKMMDSD